MQMQTIGSDTFQRIFEYSSDIISIHDMDGSFLEVSPACEELLGYTQEELMGISPYDLFHSGDHDKIFKSYADIKEPPHIHKIDYRIKHKEGHYIWFETTSSLMKEGEKARIVSFSRDITKRKKAEEELERALEAREQLLEILSHDLRNSFQALQVFSLLLSEDLEELQEEEIRDFSSEIHTSTIKVNEMLNNMIDWSKCHKGELPCQPRPVDLVDLLENVVSLYRGKIDQKELTINLELADPAEVFADPNMCRSIFRNLLSNALKFSNDKGTITVSCIPEGDRARIQVMDNGVGMESEKAEKLFQGDAGSEIGTRGERGTGIGLTLCRDFVHRHDGSIHAESETGKGTSVIFDLPVNEAGLP